MYRKYKRFISIGFLLALLTGVVISQITPTPTPDDEPIKVDTLLINIPLVVSDRDGRYVGGLKKEDFTILLDGDKQEIEYFADAEAPVSVAIILDMSGSTRPYMRAIKDAAKAFVEKMNPADSGAIITFNQFNKLEVVCPVTSDRKKLLGRIDSLNNGFSGGFVPRAKSDVYPDMHDSIYLAMTKELVNVKGRKAIIVLTDGFLTGQTVTPKVFEDTIVEGDTVIYPVMFVTRQHVGRDKTSISGADLLALPVTKVLDQIAAKTGGRLVVAGKDTDFKSSFQTVGDELRKQYILGFQPSNLDKLKAGKIALSVNNPAMRVRSKNVIRLKGRSSQVPK